MLVENTKVVNNTGLLVSRKYNDNIPRLPLGD